MNKKIVLALLAGAAVATICWIRRSNVFIKSVTRKKDEEAGLRSTPYPYEYTL